MSFASNKKQIHSPSNASKASSNKEHKHKSKKRDKKEKEKAHVKLAKIERINEQASRRNTRSNVS